LRELEKKQREEEERRRREEEELYKDVEKLAKVRGHSVCCSVVIIAGTVKKHADSKVIGMSNSYSL
jgi:hypothetical protein